MAGKILDFFPPFLFAQLIYNDDVSLCYFIKKSYWLVR